MIPDKFLPVGSRIIGELAFYFKCNRNTVRNALQLKCNNRLANDIRAKSLGLLADEIERFKDICDKGIYTETNNNFKDERYVYVFSHPKHPGEYKVGIAKNYERRLNSYQTFDPDSEYKSEYESKKTPYYREVEKYILNKFPNEHEWVKGNQQDIIDEIKKTEGKKVKDNTKDAEGFDVGRDFRKELCNKYGYNIWNVNSALSFKNNSPLENEIRYNAYVLSVAELNRVKKFM